MMGGQKHHHQQTRYVWYRVVWWKFPPFLLAISALFPGH